MHENMQMHQAHKIYDETKHVELISYLKYFLKSIYFFLNLKFYSPK